MKRIIPWGWFILMAVLQQGFSARAGNPAETIRFEYLTIKEGLSQNMVDCILKDSRGFMWFGTWNGLNRYDGYSFTVFKHDDADYATLSDNFILDMTEGPYGNIWIGTENGLNVYLCRQDRFLTYSTESSGYSVSAPRIQTVMADRDGYVWVGTDMGLDRVHPEGESGKISGVESFFSDSALTSFPLSVHEIYQDPQGRIWIGTSDGVYIYDTENDSFLPKENNLIPEVVSRLTSARAFLMDSLGTMWIGTQFGVFRYDFKNNNIIRYFHRSSDPGSLVHNVAMSITCDGEGNILVGTLGGLSIYDETNDSFRNYTTTPDSHFGLNNEFVNCLLYTEDGNVWIGTERGGINRYNIYRRNFDFFEWNPWDENSLSHNTVNSVCEDDKYLWIGTAGGGLNRYEKTTGNFRHYMYTPGDSDGLTSDFISVLHRDREGNLWVGSWGGGLHLLTPGNMEEGKFIRYLRQPSIPGQPISNYISSIVEDSRGNLWIGTIEGLMKYDAENEEFISVRLFDDIRNMESVGCLQFDADGNLWVGTRYALYRITGESLQVVHEKAIYADRFVSDPDNPASISGNYVISLLSGSNGDLWIGTYGQGLNLLRREDLKKESWVFSHFSEESGLCNDVVYAIQEDRKGRLWMSTDNGLSEFDPEKKTFRNFYVEDGLLSDQFYWSAGATGKSGELYFGSMQGLISFYPDSIREMPRLFPTTITGFRVFNTPVEVGEKYERRVLLPQSILTSDHLVLPRRIKEFSFQFSALNYVQSERITYRYRMVGFDNRWRDATGSRQATYTNLSGGDYTFYVQAVMDGQQVGEPAMMAVTIIPPVWQRTWFKILAVFALLGFVLLFIRYRTYSLNRQKKKLEALVKERTAEVEGQKVELESQAADLRESYRQLEKRQELIEGQKRQLEDQNSQISEQRDKLIELNEKVKQIQQEQLNFFTQVSHEFRSPLNLIISPIEQMMKETRLDEGIKNNLQIIYQNTQRLLRLINQLLEIRKVETGEIEMKVTRGDLVSFIENISRSFSNQASMKGIRFEYHPGERIEMYFDREIVENIVYNLLSNAIKYTPQKGMVKVATGVGNGDKRAEAGVNVMEEPVEYSRGTGSYAWIMVSDTGPGIPPEMVKDVFRKFHRLPQEGKRDVRGSGIGLYLAREMTRAHRGQIYVRSEPGTGTTFTVFLPTEREQYHAGEIIDEPPEEITDDESQGMPYNETMEVNARGSRIDEAEQWGKPVLLFVDDDCELCRYIQNTLTRSFHVITAFDGTEGWEKAQKHSPDLIISDVMMPGMDGLELCARLKNDLNTSHIPVILLSARAETESHFEGYGTGADDYVAKPFHLDLLEVKAKSLMENRKKLRRLFLQNLTPVPGELTTTRPDEEFLQNVLKAIEENMADPSFNVQKLARVLCISRSLLHKKLIAYTDVKASDFIISMRLKKAARLLKENKMNISEIAYATGYSDPKYFSRSFKKFFGISPKEYGGMSA
ncbi:MAG: two-component regulator propeller domain-containing protein [Bacteroidales bacterium]